LVASKQIIPYRAEALFIAMLLRHRHIAINIDNPYDNLSSILPDIHPETTGSGHGPHRIGLNNRPLSGIDLRFVFWKEGAFV